MSTTSLPSYVHAAGCPGVLNPDAERVEYYRAQRPDGTVAEVLHCQDCAVRVIDGEMARDGDE